jgi:hypothetical protein
MRLGLRDLPGGGDNDNMEPSSTTSTPSTEPSTPSSADHIRMVDNSTFLYGRVDQEREENMELVEAVPGPSKERENARSLRPNMLSNEERDAAEILQTMAHSSEGMFKIYISSVPLEMWPPVLVQCKTLRSTLTDRLPPRYATLEVLPTSSAF